MMYAGSHGAGNGKHATDALGGSAEQAYYESMFAEVRGGRRWDLCAPRVAKRSKEAFPQAQKANTTAPGYLQLPSDQPRVP
jgi:hypothetical protein